MGLSLGDIEKATGDNKLVGRARLSLGSLEKASREVGADLTKGLLECGVEIDASLSLGHAYSDGSVQKTGERVLAWVAIVDSNAEFEAGFFESSAHAPKSLGLSNYRGWVRANQPRLGGTNLYEAIEMGAKMAAKALNAPKILDLIAQKRMGSGYKLSLQEVRPVQTDRIYHLTIITDGAPNTGPRPYKDAIKELVVRLSYAGIFIKFIFVGNDRDGQEFLQFLDDMPVAKHQDDLADTGPADPRINDVDYYPGARYIDNVDKVEFLGGLSSVGDQAFAEAMTQELSTYVPCAVRRGLLSTANVVML
jgi:hypothetical protein